MRQGDFGEQAVKAQIDTTSTERAIAGGIAAKFRTHRDPGGHPALGFVEAKVADDLLIGRSLVLALAPERAELTGEMAAVIRQLVDGRRSRLVRSDTAEARKKRYQPSREGH